MLILLQTDYRIKLTILIKKCLKNGATAPEFQNIGNNSVVTDSLSFFFDSILTDPIGIVSGSSKKVRLFLTLNSCPELFSKKGTKLTGILNF